MEKRNKLSEYPTFTQHPRPGRVQSETLDDGRLTTAIQKTDSIGLPAAGTYFLSVQEFKIPETELKKIQIELLKRKLNLGEKTCKVLTALMNAERTDDKIIINPTELVELTGISKRTVYNALYELLNKSLIFRTTQAGIYWLNHSVFDTFKNVVEVKIYTN